MNKNIFDNISKHSDSRFQHIFQYEEDRMEFEYGRRIYPISLRTQGTEEMQILKTLSTL